MRHPRRHYGDYEDYLSAQEAETPGEHHIPGEILRGDPESSRTPAPIQILAQRHGADMPETLETATYILREQIRTYSDKAIAGMRLDPQEVRALNQLIDSLTKVDRSVRQWRQIQAEEMGQLTDEEIMALLPVAASSLGLPEPSEESTGNHQSTPKESTDHDTEEPGDWPSHDDFTDTDTDPTED